MITIDFIWENCIPEPNSGCWLWTKGASSGYGSIPLGQFDRIGSHVAAYEAVHGSVNGLFVLHKCDVKLCCNPDHLYLGDQAQNMQDKVDRDRQAKGMRHGMAKLTIEEVERIRVDDRVYRVIAETYGISKSQVSNIKLGKLWR